MPPPRGYPNFLEGPADYDMTADVHSESYPAIDPTKADLRGKVVYVNGASRGMGAGTAISFARAGAPHIAISARSDSSTVAQSMRDAAKAAGHPEPDVLMLKVDLNSEPSVAAAAEEVKNRFGRLDIVVNSAGLASGVGKAPIEMSFSEWKANFDLNVHAPWLVMKYFLPLLLSTENGSKTVVFVTSVGALLTSPGVSSYQTSKLALLRLMEHMSAAYGDQGLLTFCVHPGNVNTGFVEVAKEFEPIFCDSPDLCGNTLVYLTSEKRDWLAGRYVNVTWDMPQLMAKKDELVEGDKLKVRLVV